MDCIDLAAYMDPTSLKFNEFNDHSERKLIYFMYLPINKPNTGRTVRVAFSILIFAV